MDLDFSQEQEMLRETTRGVLAEHCPVEVVRAMEDDPKGYPDELWKQLGELGLVGLLLPESCGGSAQSLLEAVIVYEELGRALAPTPHLPSAVLAGGALLAAGSGAQKQAWLRPIATGEALVTPAWLEPDGGYGPRGVQLRAAEEGGAIILTGTKRHVPYASSASRLLVLARSGDADEALDLFLVDPSAEGVTLDYQRSLAQDSQYRVDLRDVRVDPRGVGRRG